MSIKIQISVQKWKEGRRGILLSWNYTIFIWYYALQISLNFKNKTQLYKTSQEYVTQNVSLYFLFNCFSFPKSNHSLPSSLTSDFLIHSRLQSHHLTMKGRYGFLLAGSIFHFSFHTWFFYILQIHLFS